jgi:hypothetical protein
MLHVSIAQGKLESVSVSADMVVEEPEIFFRSDENRALVWHGLVCFCMISNIDQSLPEFSNYSAESWPLTKPLQCVSLRIERRGDVLLLIFTYTQDGQKGSKLFALCSIDIVNKPHKLEHYVEAVLDSTRYFVVRVTDEKAGREALIGLGFRDREEAGDFRAALAKYETDIQQGR